MPLLSFLLDTLFKCFFFADYKSCTILDDFTEFLAVRERIKRDEEELAREAEELLSRFNH